MTNINKVYKTLKSNFPCKECITYPICRSKIIDIIEKQSKVRNNRFDVWGADEILLYYYAQDYLSDKCSIYKKYEVSFFRLFIEDLHDNQIKRHQLASIIKQEFNLQSIFDNLGISTNNNSE